MQEWGEPVAKAALAAFGMSGGIGGVKRRRSLLLWAILAALYLGFRLWYDGGGGPLTPAEVQHYVGDPRGARHGPRARREPAQVPGDDTGHDFVMANFIDLQDKPSAQEELDRYMAHMYPAMFARAGHPVLAGPVVGDALDIWGIENAEHWTMVGLVRYRSRRDMIEIATDPAFSDAYSSRTARWRRPSPSRASPSSSSVARVGWWPARS